MNIHEYQAKNIFAKYKVPIPEGILISSTEEAIEAARELGGNIWVVKAQIHSGGRGLGGGVKIAKNIEDVKKLANDILGMTLITYQTGPEGRLVNKVYIEKGVNIHNEYYLGVILDRAKEMPIIMASKEGGIDIEKVAKDSPEKIIKVTIDPSIGFQGFHGRELVFRLGITDKNEQKKFIDFASKIYKLYLENDAELIEINPLIKNEVGDYLALDGKMSFDDSALWRHPEIQKMRDFSEEDINESEASKYGLSYVTLDGEIGCIVNGAGLAMATMDTINCMGGTPANFLDVGGKANIDAVAKGFEIILRNSKVKAIFVNIFGGIVRCDRIANGILEATKKIGVNIPVIVRLDGTNSIEASKILENANIDNVIVATDLSDGVLKAIQAAKKI